VGDVTYQAWEFGIHGYKPYTATQIFEKKEGDCKDKALLFNTMLKEIGVDGYPVLLYADQSRDEEDLSLAMVGDFNHCIAYVPDTDGKGTPMFFDGTAEYASAYLPPLMDQGAKVLVVKPEGAELMTIPKGSPDTAGLVQKWHIVVHEDGRATATCERVWRGDFAIMARQQFSVEGQREQEMQKLFTRVLGKIKITDLKFDDLRDLSKPEARCTFTIEIDKFVKGSGDTVTIPTGMSDVMVTTILQSIGMLVSQKKREQDLVLTTGLSFRNEIDYELPAGWSVAAAPEDAAIDLPSAGFTSKAASEGGKLHLMRDMRLKGERVKIAEYPSFRESVSKAVQVMQQQWKVKKGEAPAAVPETPAKEPAPAVPAGGK
jgi:hypothetical protein